MVIEISFPRGGRKPLANSKPQDVKRDHDLFGRKRKRVNKHAVKTNVFQEKEDISKTTETLHVEQLSSRTIQDGMTLLGCVKEIQKVALEISLPGRLWGKVFVNNISKPYTKLLHTVIDQNETDDYKQLIEIFTPGQCVAVKVLNLNDEKFGITLSMMPQQINANISHVSVKMGMTLWGAISEIEDHGYVVDLGINNCRAFLKKENCDKKEYAVGELLWFSVLKADISSTATTVMLTTQKEKVANMKILDEISLDHLLPGMQVDFTISQILANGLEGKFFNNYTGYIKVGKLKKSFHEYEVGKICQARILYMMPVTKIAYCTLKSLEPHKREKIEDGSIMNCKIQGVTPLGIYIKLENNVSRGFVPLYRARKVIPENENVSDYLYLKRKYPKKSNERCRILNYDYFEQIYICSMEKELIDKNVIFSLDNLKAGQEVSAEITEIQPNGLLVKIQQVNGYIKNEHLCDTVLKNYNNIKSRFKVGKTVQARVWVINKAKHLLYLTMRPSLVSTDLVLKDYTEAKEKQQYLGVIKQIQDNGILVQFFGDVHGWVPTKKMKLRGVKNPNDLFKIGQLAKCTVVKCKSTKLTLSLYSSTEITQDIEPELKLGENVNGIVSHVTSAGVHVIVKNSDITAFIPTSYLSKFEKLAPAVAKLYQPGDEIFDLVCVSKTDTLPTLSLRNPELTEDNVQDVKTLKNGTILNCSVLTTDNAGINLEAPIEHFKKYIFVPKENISDDHDISTSNLKLNQLMYAKVFNVSKNLEAITGSTKLSDVWDFDIQSSVQYFSEYINEVLRIRDRLKLLNNPLACLNLGEIVSGVVRFVNYDKSCIIQLDNGVKAFVQKEYAKENLSVNDKVEGVLLCWNFEDNAAEVALCPRLIPKINQLQNGSIKIPPGITNKSNAHAEILLVRHHYILGVLRGAAGKRQFIFFPSKLHANDLKPNLSDYVVGEYINVQVNKIENQIIIGLSKQLIRDMNYKWKNHLKSKAKRLKLETLVDAKVKNDKKKDKKKNIETNGNDVKIIQGEEKQTKKGKENKKNKNNNTSDEIINTRIDINKNKKENKCSISNMDEVITEVNKKEKRKKNSISDVEEIITKAKKTKKEKKNSISDVEEIITEGNKNSFSTDEEIVEVTKKNKKERKKKNSVSNDEEITKQERQKKRKLDEDNEPAETEIDDSKHKSEVKKSKKEKKNSISDVEEIIIESKKIKKEKKNSFSTDEEIVEDAKKNKKERKKKNSISSDDEINKQERQKKRALDEDNKQAEIEKNVNKHKAKKSKQELVIEDVPAVLPGADNFWNISEELVNVEEESSDDDEPNKKQLEKLQKKKKISPAEKAEVARLEEERIRKIEFELADAESIPKTSDQFDRLVLANPNNSMFWINYMAFHLEATEIEKARAIARKALKTIEFREEQEKLNVWIAFLNLENRYGTKESFASVLEEAVQMNDSLTVNLQALNILSESKKTTEFLELVRLVSRKFKQEFKMWTATAEACYKCDLKEEARNLMQRSLKSLDEKQHINILVQFAFMEARYNEPERAEALLEKVLASYPRRVDVWTSYVDMLIKGNRIHIARNVLERAVGQKLPARKMKTLFSKYVQFETKYGDDESVSKVRQLASNYVKTALN